MSPIIRFDPDLFQPRFRLCAGSGLFLCAGHGAQRHERRCQMRTKVKHEVTGEMKVLLRTLMTGTVSRTARVSAARWNLKEAVSKPAIRRTGSAYEAVMAGARGQNYPKPESHPEGHGGICDGWMRGKSRALPREACRGARPGLGWPRGHAMPRQESAEVIVAGRTKRHAKDRTR